MRRFWISAALCAALFTAGCKNETTPANNLQEEVTFTHEGDLAILHDDKPVILLEIEIADNDFETETGLMYRTKMQEDRCMLFIFKDIRERFFYMKNTEIALDIIYIGEDKKIKKIAANAQPMDETSIPSEAPVKYVLEVNAGMAAKWGVQVGDSISYEKI